MHRKGSKNSILLVDGRPISWVGNGLLWFLVACKSRKMGPSFKAKSEGSQVRRGAWMSKITTKRSKDTWEILGHSAGLELSSLVHKAPYCRGSLLQNKVFCGQSRLQGMDPSHTIVPPTLLSGAHCLCDWLSSANAIPSPFCSILELSNKN